ncbi:MAG: winged helix-turn-helix transcriptional regulator [Methanopyri archaeon]|nr:winged helix-turn-helix transcriptional regulator [Methanopyri archaeon]
MVEELFRVPEELKDRRELMKTLILSMIGIRQPHVHLGEIGEELGVSLQAVHNYVKELIEEGLVEKRGRAEYRLTGKGAERAIEGINNIRRFTTRVAEALGKQLTWAAIAEDRINEGDEVYLYMKDGILYATKSRKTRARAVACADAEPGQDVPITNIEGDIPGLEYGEVILVCLPSVREGGTRRVDLDRLKEVLEEEEYDVIGAVGTVGKAALNMLGIEDPDLKFGVLEGAATAALKGLRALVLISSSMLNRAKRKMEERGVKYRVLYVQS